MPSTGLEGSGVADAISVAVGIVVNDQGRVLIARRHDTSHQGGKWEFPGGKKEAGESPLDALRRELNEELGIHVQTAQPLIQIRHSYPEKAVHLDVWRVTRFAGDPHGREGQPLRWVTLSELHGVELPEADRPILMALWLPRLYLITDSKPLGRGDFLQRLEQALVAGAKLIQLREPQLSPRDYCVLAKQVADLCHQYSARLLLNAEPEVVGESGADGIHLNSHRLVLLKERPLSSSHLVAASCHNATQIERARQLGADFIVLSPVRPTPSHPGATPLGWERFGALCATASMPVFALGGMRAEDTERARLAGAQGLAMISGVWDASDLKSVVAQLSEQ